MIIECHHFIDSESGVTIIEHRPPDGTASKFVVPHLAVQVGTDVSGKPLVAKNNKPILMDEATTIEEAFGMLPNVLDHLRDEGRKHLSPKIVVPGNGTAEIELDLRKLRAKRVGN